MDFLKIDAEDEDELFFEGPEPEIPAPAAKPARKRAAKTKAADLAAMLTIDPVDSPPPPPPAPAPAPEAAPVVAAPADPVDQPAGEPVVIVRGARLPAIAMILAAIAALFAAVGLLMTLRTMATLDAARADVEKREAALARMPALLEEIETLARDQRAELARAASERPSDVVTKADLQAQMTNLRFGLSRMQAPGTAALAGVVRAGQAELADRINDLSDRVDSIEHPRAAAAAH